MASLVASADPGPRRFRLLRVWGTLVRVLASYGGFKLLSVLRASAWAERALPALHRDNARRIKATILAVQGLFIKVGQLISILSNVLPADFRNELEELQDRISPRPLAGIRARLRAELGAEPEQLFLGFEPEPIASASLAQVHVAALADGRKVAVKVQHADIETTARRDLATLRRILRLLGLLFGLKGLTEVHAQVSAMIAEELDFRREAEALTAIAANFPDDGVVGFPQVVPERSTERVLTTTFIDGFKVSDLPALEAAGIDRRQLAERVLRAYCEMIFKHGLYHADPHPGNLLVEPSGRLVFLDFGAVARLSAPMKEGILKLIEGVLRRNREQILTALARMGFVARGPEAGEVAAAVVDYVTSRFLAGLELESFNLQDLQFDPKVKLEMMADLARLDISLRQLTSAFTVPREWILLERTLLLLAGLCTHLDPEMKPMAVVRPYVQELVLGSDQDWMALARTLVKDLALSALTLPEEVRRLVRSVNQGEVEINVRGLPESAQLLYAASQQLLWAVLALSTGALATWARLAGDRNLAMGLGGGAGFFLFCLAASLARGRRLRKLARRRGKGVGRRLGAE